MRPPVPTQRQLRSYLIAATPRTGSFLLCDLLSQTGVAGRPSEYATRADRSNWRDHCRYRTHVEYFFRLRPAFVTPNGVFGLKLMRPQWAGLLSDIERYLGVRKASPEAKLRAFLGADLGILWLRRRDRVAQAVSLARALQTGEWSSSVRGSGVPRYDRTEIDNAMASILEAERAWEQELSELDLPILQLWYEEMVEAREGAVRRAVEWLGHERQLPSTLQLSPRLQRQADARTERWIHRYTGGRRR